MIDEFAKIKEQRDRLRRALAELIGAETKEELQAMGSMLRLMPVPEADKTAMLHAIQVLLGVYDNA